MRRIELDGCSVFALTDCAPAPAPCAYSFPDAVLAQHGQAASRWFPGGQFRTRFGPFLLRRPAGDVLVDCGLGPGGVGYFPDLRGTLPEALHAAGSSLADVAEVVFTHLHVDHVGWAPFLPNARFHLAEREWLHWSGKGAQAGLPHHVEAVTRCILPLAGRLVTWPSGAEVLPGLHLLAAAGHTPGHHALLLDDRLLIAGDLWHNPAQIAVPAWCHRADMDKPAAIATRAGFAATAHDNAWLVAAGHFIEENAFGRIETCGPGLAFAPLTA